MAMLKTGEGKEHHIKGWMLDAVIKVERPEWNNKTHIPIYEYVFKRTNIFSRRQISILGYSERQAWQRLHITLITSKKI